MSSTTSRGYPYPQLTDTVDVPGDIQALAEAIDADVADLADVPLCHVVQQSGGTQSGWSSITETAVTFGAGSTVVDTLGIHSEGSNTSRLVIGMKLGWWEVSGVYVPASNGANTEPRAMLFKNGSFVVGSGAGWTIPTTTHLYGIPTPTIEIEATAGGDYIELRGYMTAGSGTLGTGYASYLACSLRAKWLRES